MPETSQYHKSLVGKKMSRAYLRVVRQVGDYKFFEGWILLNGRGWSDGVAALMPSEAAFFWYWNWLQQFLSVIRIICFKILQILRILTFSNHLVYQLGSLSQLVSYFFFNYFSCIGPKLAAKIPLTNISTTIQIPQISSSFFKANFRTRRNL